MQALLKISRAIDWFTAHLGRWLLLLIMACTVFICLNEVVRKTLKSC